MGLVWLNGWADGYVQVHAYDTTAHLHPHTLFLLFSHDLGAKLGTHARTHTYIRDPTATQDRPPLPARETLTLTSRASELIIRGVVVAHGLVRHLGQRAPDLPRLCLEGAVLDVGLQHDVLGEVALALAAGDELAAAGVVVAREALHARDAHDGLLDEPQALIRRAAAGAGALVLGLVGDAEVGEPRVPQLVVVAHELPLGADSGGAGVDGAGEGLEELGRADAPQRVLVARRHGLGHLRVQRLGRGDRGPLVRAEQRPREPLGPHRDEVHTEQRPEVLDPVLEDQPDQLAELDRRARESPYGRGHDGYCLGGQSSRRKEAGQEMNKVPLVPFISCFSFSSPLFSPSPPVFDFPNLKQKEKKAAVPVLAAASQPPVRLTRKQERRHGFGTRQLALLHRSRLARLPRSRELVPLRGAAGRGGADAVPLLAKAMLEPEARRSRRRRRGRPYQPPRREQPLSCVYAREVGHNVSSSSSLGKKCEERYGVVDFRSTAQRRLMPPSTPTLS